MRGLARNSGRWITGIQMQTGEMMRRKSERKEAKKEEPAKTDTEETKNPGILKSGTGLEQTVRKQRKRETRRGRAGKTWRNKKIAFFSGKTRSQLK